MNSGVTHDSSRPGADSAQPSMTWGKARSRVISNGRLRRNFARLCGTWKRSSSKTARGSGDHHVMGLTVHGKIPLRYASRSRRAEKSPPMATRPSLDALAGSGKRSRRSSRSEVGSLMVMRHRAALRQWSVPVRHLLHAQRGQEHGLIHAAHFQREQVLHVVFVNLGFFALLGFAQREPTAHAHVVEDLQEPFDLRRRQRQIEARVRLPKMLRIVEQREDLSAVFAALLGEGFVEQALGFVRVWELAWLADAMVRGGNERIEFQRLDQQLVLACADVENESALVCAQQFHDSGSMVACRVYFWSWWT